MKSLNDRLLAGKFKAKAEKSGRENAEAAFLAFHGLWTVEKVEEARDLFHGRISATPGFPALTTIQEIAVEAFSARLKALVAGGQNLQGRG